MYRIRILLFVLIAQNAFAQIRIGIVASSRNEVAQAYYISPSGNDANAGTSPSSAWQSIAKVNATTFHPGDSILFQGGQAFSGNLVINESGTEGSPIVFGSYGTGRAQINAGTTYHGIKAVNQEYIHIKDLILNGPGAQNANVWNGILLGTNQTVKELRGVLIDSVKVQNFAQFGIAILAEYVTSFSENIKGFHGLTVQYCELTENGLGGIFTNGKWSEAGTYAVPVHDSMHITHCLAYSNPGRNGNTTGMHLGIDDWTMDWEWSGSGILMSGTKNSLIEYCTAYNNAYANAGQGCVGIWIAEADHCTIQYCESYSNQNGGDGQYDGAGFDFDGSVTNSIIQYCYAHNNDGAGFMFVEWGSQRNFANNVMRYCISENDAATSLNSGALSFGVLNVSYPIDSTLIHNNVFYIAGGAKAIALISNNYGTANQLRNNIFYFAGAGSVIDHVGSSVEPTTQYTFNHNLYFSHTNAAVTYRNGGNSYTTLAAYQAATGQEANGLNTNPMLANPGGGGTVGYGNALSGLTAYQLIAGSPALAAGTAITGAPATDFYGNTLAGAVNIGAHDNSSTATSYTITDSDASAYVTAAALTSNVQKWAVDQYVQDLKAAGVWTKMRAIYPFLGGTADAHKWNLKDPRDLDAAFRMTFTGGITHSSGGMETNGTNGRADTRLQPSVTLTPSSGGFSIYSTNTAKLPNFEAWGVVGGGGAHYEEFAAFWDASNTSLWIGQDPYPNFPDATRTGLYVANRNSATNTQSWQNGTKKLDVAQDNGLMTTTFVPLGCTRENNNFTSYYNAFYTYFAIHTGMTDTEVGNYTTAANAFQRRIGRSTY